MILWIDNRNFTRTAHISWSYTACYFVARDNDPRSPHCRYSSPMYLLRWLNWLALMLDIHFIKHWVSRNPQHVGHQRHFLNATVTMCTVHQHNGIIAQIKWLLWNESCLLSFDYLHNEKWQSVYHPSHLRKYHHSNPTTTKCIEITVSSLKW